MKKSETDEQPIEAKFVERMNALASAIDRILNEDLDNKQNGFALLTFPFGEAKDGRVNYISNASRPEMIVALQEFIARATGRIKDSDNLQ